MTNWIIEKIGFEKTFVICEVSIILFCITNIISAVILFFKKDIKVLLFASFITILIYLIFKFMQYIEENHKK